METVKCKGCGHDINDNYCPACGEERYRRITMKDVVNDFFSNLFTLEGRVLRTVKDLTIRPGYMIGDYLDGKRKGYYKPFQYYILAITIYFIFFFLWGTEMLEMFSGIGESANSVGTNTQIKEFEAKMRGFQDRNMRTLVFLQVPIYAVFIWLFFKGKSGRSFTESAVVALYVMAQTSIFGIISMCAVLIHPAIGMILNMAFMFVYLPICVRQLYKESVTASILKSVAIILIVLILFGLLMFFISITWYILSQ